MGQILDLISPTKIDISEPRFKSYDPWDMENCLLWYDTSILKDIIFCCKKPKMRWFFFVSCTREPEYINECGSNSKFPSTGPSSRVRFKVPKYGSPTRDLFRSRFLRTGPGSQKRILERKEQKSPILLQFQKKINF